ncbi:MAG: GGDEF domain-containing protein, partial [Campylobacterota bacterium]|nr:GGDEF domain-containing protein [Campylobacterota bacterium]
ETLLSTCGATANAHSGKSVSKQLFNILIHLDSNTEAAIAGEYHDWHLPHNYSEVDKLLERFRLGHYKSMPKYTSEDILSIVAVALLVIFTLIIYSRYKMLKMIGQRLQREVHLKTKELEKTNVELMTIFDLNPHITIITDGKHIQRVNRRFLGFLEIKTLSEFTNEYDCICDRFELREGYLQAQMGDQTWIEHVDTHPSQLHKAMIIQNKKEYIFSIHVANIHYLDNASYIVTLEDITKINTIAFTDKLTTLYNRSRLDEKLSWLYENYTKEKKIFSIALIDIDHFKRVNDKYGHIIGDRVLIDLAKLLQNNSRDSDTVGRWGGEEFMIIYENISAQNAYKLIERIRKAVESYDFVTAEVQTVSIGIAQYLGEDINIKEFIDQADQALYQAKNSGRNQTVIYS